MYLPLVGLVVTVILYGSSCSCQSGPGWYLLLTLLLNQDRFLPTQRYFQGFGLQCAKLPSGVELEWAKRQLLLVAEQRQHQVLHHLWNLQSIAWISGHNSPSGTEVTWAQTDHAPMRQW